MHAKPITKPRNPETVRVHLHLHDYQIEWMDDNNIQRSGFIRDLLDDVVVHTRTTLPDNQTTLNDYTNNKKQP